MTRPLTHHERRILGIIREHYGPANTEDDVVFGDQGDAVIWVKDGTGVMVLMANLTNLAEWRQDGTIPSDEILKTEWLQIADRNVGEVCVQFHPDKAPDIEPDRIRALCEAAASGLGASLRVSSGEDGGRYVNFFFSANDLAGLWEALRSRLLNDSTVGPAARRATIVTRTGDDGWNDYRLIHHFDVLAKVRERWRIDDGYWYPLSGERPDTVEAFQDTCFARGVPLTALRGMLRGRGIERVWELREYDEEYELATEWFEPVYNGAEGYWTSESLDWIVYASHESSVSVGGWMLDEVKNLWPEWRNHIWTSPFFE